MELTKDQRDLAWQCASTLSELTWYDDVPAGPAGHEARGWNMGRDCFSNGKPAGLAAWIWETWKTTGGTGGGTVAEREPARKAQELLGLDDETAGRLLAPNGAGTAGYRASARMGEPGFISAELAAMVLRELDDTGVVSWSAAARRLKPW